MRKQLLVATALSALFIVPFSTSASAKHRHYRHQHHTSTFSRNVNTEGQIVSHPSGCPSHAFCGCGVSVRVFGRPIRNLFLASNWFKFPPGHPGPGMVAVRNHHVMYIEAVDGNGNAVVYDPNSGGHATRIHTRSLAGYSVRNPHG